MSRDITLPPSPNEYTVTDLLIAVSDALSGDMDVSNDLFFYDAHGDPINPSTNYVKGVEYNSKTWTAGQRGYDGWEFRVNDKFPVFPNGTEWTGASILQTYLKNGDTVHFFYDLPADVTRAVGVLAANYVRGIRLASNASSLTVQLQGHTVYIGPQPTDPPMYADNYKNVQAGVTAYLYDSAGETPLGTQVSDAHGRVVFSGSFTSGEAYIVKTDPVYFPYFSASVLPADTYIALTGAYSRVTIP